MSANINQELSADMKLGIVYIQYCGECSPVELCGANICPHEREYYDEYRDDNGVPMKDGKPFWYFIMSLSTWTCDHSTKYTDDWMLRELQDFLREYHKMSEEALDDIVVSQYMLPYSSDGDYLFEVGEVFEKEWQVKQDLFEPIVK